MSGGLPDTSLFLHSEQQTNHSAPTHQKAPPLKKRRSRVSSPLSGRLQYRLQTATRTPKLRRLRRTRTTTKSRNSAHGETPTLCHLSSEGKQSRCMHAVRGSGMSDTLFVTQSRAQEPLVCNSVPSPCFPTTAPVLVVVYEASAGPCHRGDLEQTKKQQS